MARKKNGTAGKVTADRVHRLFRLLTLLGRGPQLRSSLTRQLRLGVRGFYRDLEALRHLGIEVELNRGRYRLGPTLSQAIDGLPFPDPGLTLGEARILARGRSPGHKRIRIHLEAIEG